MRHRRRSPFILSSRPVHDKSYMSKANPRKRQFSQDPSLHANNASPPQSKRQNLSNCRPPAAFWDNLSKIWLTRRALRELKRRQTHSTSSKPYPRYRGVRRPSTRNFLAQLRRNRPAPDSALSFLRHCEASTLKDIQLFAKRGGPDLSDLRGVCSANTMCASDANVTA